MAPPAAGDTPSYLKAVSAVHRVYLDQLENIHQLPYAKPFKLLSCWF
ncbi:hypothetical protein COO91_05295 [Nostoc flagelliforme CCNUN1]|uniref:Uncharacterized protein n=1 Tax=Nostoc flagelliforme CCNUN1 TaxID=2038116 RepID=A0A2K8SVE0_9NOSO|nr:hypothetical protein COO91_05295 [Nostoc flagelliforme CCNUN1]